MLLVGSRCGAGRGHRWSSVCEDKRSCGGRRSQRRPCPLAGGVRGPDGPDRGTFFAGRTPARKLMLGLLSDLPRKNCRTIAEWAGDGTLDGMQHLHGRAKRDADPAGLRAGPTPTVAFSYNSRAVDGDDPGRHHRRAGPRRQHPHLAPAERRRHDRRRSALGAVRVVIVCGTCGRCWGDDPAGRLPPGVDDAAAPDPRGSSPPRNTRPNV
jgi:hypothetical protein